MTATDPFFPTVDFGLATLSCPLSEIVASTKTPIEEWTDGGLGPARSTGVHLACGCPVWFVEHTLRLDLGTTVYVDASDFSRVGPDELLSRVLAIAGCNQAAVSWAQGSDRRDAASKRASWAVSYRAAREKSAEE